MKRSEKIRELRLLFLNKYVEDGQDGSDFDCDVIDTLNKLSEKYVAIENCTECKGTGMIGWGLNAQGTAAAQVPCLKCRKLEYELAVKRLLSGELFPVIRTAEEILKFPDVPTHVPLVWLKRFEHQIVYNHRQILKRLEERGGLSPLEIYLAFNKVESVKGTNYTRQEACDWLANKPWEKR